jgi:hypothetical protein
MRPHFIAQISTELSSGHPNLLVNQASNSVKLYQTGEILTFDKIFCFKPEQSGGAQDASTYDLFNSYPTASQFQIIQTHERLGQQEK